PDAMLSTNVALLNGTNNFTGQNSLGGMDLLLRDGSDFNHGLGWYGGNKFFGDFENDGPVLYGNRGGALGTTYPEASVALSWDYKGNVFMPKLFVNSTVSAFRFTGNAAGLTNLNLAVSTGGAINASAGFMANYTLSGDKAASIIA